MAVGNFVVQNGSGIGRRKKKGGRERRAMRRRNIMEIEIR